MLVATIRWQLHLLFALNRNACPVPPQKQVVQGVLLFTTTICKGDIVFGYRMHYTAPYRQGPDAEKGAYSLMRSKFPPS